MPPRPIAFAPELAAPRRPLLWSGEGIGASTPVATPDGPVPAERLRRGDPVSGGGGRVLRLTELSHVTLPAEMFRRLGMAPPVLVEAGALGPGMPTVPLLLGPAQRIRLAGGWIAAGQLVDGQRVRYLGRWARMVLLGHGGDSAILAAGVVLGPAGAPPLAARKGPVVEALLRQADAAGGHGGPLEGYVDHADRFGLVGWARDPAATARLVPLEVLVSGTVVAQVLADLPRPDLVSRDPARSGPGGHSSAMARHGFALRFEPPLPPRRPWLLGVRPVGGGAALPGTPLLLDAAAPTPELFDIALAGLVGGVPGALFLAGLIDAAAGARRR